MTDHERVPQVDERALDVSKLAEELQERTALKFMGDCKCGACQLVPREMLDRAILALYEAKRYLFDLHIRAALSSPSAGVRVKKLEWPPRCPIGQRVHNRPALVNYTIAHYGADAGSPIYRWAQAHSPWSEPMDTYEAAQAAAQVDFELRILSALEKSYA